MPGVIRRVEGLAPNCAVVLACSASKCQHNLLMHKRERTVKSGRLHARLANHLEVVVDQETVLLRMLLVVLVRQHSADDVYIAVQGLR